MLVHVVKPILTSLYPILQITEGRRKHFISILTFVFNIKELNLEALA